MTMKRRGRADLREVMNDTKLEVSSGRVPDLLLSSIGLNDYYSQYISNCDNDRFANLILLSRLPALFGNSDN
jgi:hypothetical protein